MNRRLKNFILRRLAVLLVSWLPSSHSFGIESTNDAALHHVRQPPLNSLASRSSLVFLESGSCSNAILQRRYDRVVSRRLDATELRLTA